MGVIDNIIQDKQDIKNQLGSTPEVFPTVKKFNNKFQVKRHSSKIINHTYNEANNVMIWGSATEGIWGTNVWGSQETAYDESLYAIIPDNNLFVENLLHLDFIDNTTEKPIELWLKCNGNLSDETGTYTVTESGTVSYVAGKLGQSADFDGTAYGTIVSDDFRVASATLMFWVNPDSISGYIMSYGSSTSDRLLIGLASSQWRVYDQIDGSANNIQFGTPQTGQWQHFAIVFYSDGTKDIWIDGTHAQNINNGENLTGISTSATLYIVSQISGANQGNLQLDDVRFYASEFTENEIQAIVHAGRGVDSNNIKDWYYDEINEEYLLHTGEILKSEIVAKIREPIVSATLTLDSSATATIEMSNDSGSTWETATSGESHPFASSTTTDELKYRITGLTDDTLISKLQIKINT